VQVLFLARANTDGDAVVWLPKQRIVVAGETVILPFPYGFESYPAEWVAVLEKLRAMPFRILLPGHDMPQKDRVQIDRIISALNNVQNHVARLVAQGLALAQVQSRVDVSADTAAFVGQDPWLRKRFARFWAEPIIASTYKEAKGQPIVQSLKG
jgi:glyoxylase-like metal-dependent hydrolase (beta-lactamase superfamily II)